MQRSTDRILTTHVGSLPRPADLREMWSKQTSGLAEEALQERLRSAVGEVVSAFRRKRALIFQTMASLASRCAPHQTAALGAITSLTASPDSCRRHPKRLHRMLRLPGAPMRIVGVRWEQREFAEFYADTGLGAPSTAASRPMCAGPIAYNGQEALRRDLANLRAVKDDAGVEEAFVASIATGSLEMFCRAQNSHYSAAEAFFEAIAAAMRRGVCARS